jgi:FlaA1/EpsC-like NDP-sugar epimerase
MLQRLLVTGGTGFLGRHLALALKADYEVVLTGRNNKQNMYAREVTGCDVLPMDVVDIESVRDAFIETAPNIVIHAAATKFVDLAELQPMECVSVNVVGSQNVLRVALERGVSMLIGVSTDKASPPIRNTYGLSKALMERMFAAMNRRGDTRLACVRYGNVAWSTGSVLPVWKRMHDETGVIGSTGPEMRRFFFTVDEAVALIRRAMAEIDTVQGKVLARRMKAARIKDLLTVWTAAKGGRWEQIEGRPGERDDEFLIGSIELPYTYELASDGIPHYVIAFNEKAPTPLATALSSANTDTLTEPEMLALIDSPAE